MKMPWWVTRITGTFPDLPDNPDGFALDKGIAQVVWVMLVAIAADITGYYTIRSWNLDLPSETTALFWERYAVVCLFVCGIAILLAENWVAMQRIATETTGEPPA